MAAGLDRAGGEEQVDDDLIGAVVAVVRPDRPQGFGSAWEVLCANHDRIGEWVKDGLTVVKIGDLSGRLPLGGYRLGKPCAGCDH